MKTHVRMFWLVALVAAAMSLACGADSPVTPPHSQTPMLKNLTQREHVLNNIEAAYNQRRVDWYNGVLDANFTFFLSPGDVGGGLPESWNRADDIDANTKLFDRNYTALPCQSISLDIRTEDGLHWTESTHTPASGPDETWYTTTVYYNFQFEIAPNTYINDTGTKASFTVRDAGPSGKYAHHWQLVEMRDDGAQHNLIASRSATSTEPSDWGRVKGMYR